MSRRELAGGRQNLDREGRACTDPLVDELGVDRGRPAPTPTPTLKPPGHG